LKISTVSTFRSKCGVGKYFEELAYPLSQLCDLTIHAEKVENEEPPIQSNKLNYVRDWKRGLGYEELYQNLIAEKPDIVHIQFESAMYNESMYDGNGILKFLDRIHKVNIPTVLTLHNVPQFMNYTPWYKFCYSHFITTNKLMDQELHKYDNVNSTVIPLGSTLFTPSKIEHEEYNLVQTGFFGYDKGMDFLIQAMPKILETIPNARLIFAGSLHPLAPQIHKDYLLKCMRLAYSLKITDKVQFTGKFLTEEHLNYWLSMADQILVNHQPVFGLFSSSASTHRALSVGRPMLLNAYDTRLSEFEDGKHCLKMTNENIAEKVIQVYKDASLREKLISGAKNYSLMTSFEKIAENHIKVYGKIE
jgi:glycosyltransferase involved in cell wall biosynthesis